jgi:hypothetical protein
LMLGPRWKLEAHLTDSDIVNQPVDERQLQHHTLLSSFALSSAPLALARLW